MEVMTHEISAKLCVVVRIDNFLATFVELEKMSGKAEHHFDESTLALRHVRCTQPNHNTRASTRPKLLITWSKVVRNHV